MIFAHRVFLVAGILGTLTIFPLYFLEGQIARVQPPAITHPEYFYGFIGVGLAWQVAFIVISRDPVRYRPLMIPAVLEKAMFGFGCLALAAMGRLPMQLLGFALFDLTLGVLFVISYVKTAPEIRSSDQNIHN
jgi:hypothetical protein